MAWTRCKLPITPDGYGCFYVGRGGGQGITEAVNLETVENPLNDLWRVKPIDPENPAYMIWWKCDDQGEEYYPPPMTGT